MTKFQFIILLMIATNVAAIGQQEPALALGQRFEGEIAGGQSITFKVELNKGEFLRAELFDGMGDNAFDLRDTQGNKLVESDFSGHFNTEPISFVATEAGIYQLVVTSERFQPTYKYSLLAAIKAVPDADDLIRLSAEQSVREINELRSAGEEEGTRRAIELALKAAETWRSLGDKVWEAYTLNGIGLSFENIGDLDEAHQYYSQALGIRQSIKDVRGEAISQKNIADLLLAKKNLEAAVELKRKASSLHNSSGNTHEEAAIFSEIGDAYRDNGKLEAALAEYQKGVVIARDAALGTLEAAILSEFADALYNLNQTVALVEKRERAATIYERLGDTDSRAEQFAKIGQAYLDANEFAQAEDHLTRAIGLYGEDSENSAYPYWLLGDVYRYTEKPAMAQKSYEKAVAVNDAEQSPAGSAGPLEDSGRLYRDSGDLRAALAQFNKALPLRQKENDLAKLGNLYSDIGLIERALGDKGKARQAFRKASIHAMTGDDGNPLGVDSATPIVDRTFSRVRATKTEFREGIPLFAGNLLLSKRQCRGLETRVFDKDRERSVFTY